MLCILGVFWIKGRQIFYFLFVFILGTKNVGGGQIMGTFHEKMKIPARKMKNEKFCFLRIQKTPKIHNILKISLIGCPVLEI